MDDLDAELQSLTAPGHQPTWTDNPMIAAVADRITAAIAAAVETAQHVNPHDLTCWQRYYLAKQAWIDAALFDDTLIVEWFDQVPREDRPLAAAALEGAIVPAVAKALQGRDIDIEYIRLGITNMLENPYGVMRNVYFRNLGLEV